MFMFSEEAAEQTDVTTFQIHGRCQAGKISMLLLDAYRP